MKWRTKMAIVIMTIATGVLLLVSGWVNPIATIALATLLIIVILTAGKERSRKNSKNFSTLYGVAATTSQSSSDCGSVSGIDC